MFPSCSVSIQEQQLRKLEPTGDRSADDPCPEVVFTACHSINLNYSEQEQTHHTLVELMAKIFPV